MTYAQPGQEGSVVSFKSRYDNFIGGEWVAPADGRYFENVTPVTGQVYCEVARSSAADIEKALDAAHAARASWGATSVADRSNLLLKIADRVEQRRGRAIGQDHLRRLDDRAAALRIMVRDPRLQRVALPIAHRIGIEHAVRLGNRRGGRSGRWLAELHVDHAAPFGLQAMRQHGHGNGVEGFEYGGHGAGPSTGRPRFKSRDPYRS
jgi:hypothetical protein